MTLANKPPAVVLLSGGLDSATVLALTIKQGFAPHAMSFRYGQRHAVELEAAQKVADRLGVVAHTIVDIDLRAFGGSSLTSDQAVPKDRSQEEMSSGVPSTYVPARNTIFLSYALAWAEVLGAQDIFIGVNALDTAGYPDCRLEYIQAFEKMANLATRLGTEGKQPLRIHTPLIQMTKVQIIQTGLDLGVDFSLTSTCYDPESDGTACGRCDACQLRRQAFLELGLVDPRQYRA